MIFIQDGDEQSTEHCQNGGSPPKGPVFHRHAKKRLPPAIEEGHADHSIAYEVPGLADEMMHLSPMRRADRAKEPHPIWIKPLAGVVRRHRGRGLEDNHENAERGRYPI